MENIYNINDLNVDFRIRHDFNGGHISVVYDEIDGKKLIKIMRFDYHIKPIQTDIIYL